METKNRRANGEGSLRFDEKSNRWIATITFNKKRKAFYGRTKQEAINKRELFKSSGGKISKSITLKNAIKNVIDDKLKNGKIQENTYYTNICTLRTISQYELANKNIDEITKEDIKIFLTELSKYSNSTIKKIYGELNYAMDYGVENGIIPYNLIKNNSSIYKPKSEGKNEKIVALEFDQQQKLIETIKKHPNKYQDIWLLAMYTGCRIGEIMALKKENINLKTKEIKIERTITRSKNGKEKIGKITKTLTSVRYVPITDKVLESIQNLLTKSKKSDLLISKSDLIGDFMSPKCPYGALKRYIEKYQIAPKCTMHMLRHTFATRSFEAGVPPKVVQHLLGHKSIQTTLDTYTDILKRYENKYLDKIEDINAQLNIVENLDEKAIAESELKKIYNIVKESHFTDSQKELLFNDFKKIEEWLKLA